MSRGAESTYLRALITRFPDQPALTLAKMAYAERPEGWSSLEACRSMVRQILGINGKKKAKDKTLFRKPRKAGWSDVIPESLMAAGHWKAVEIAGPARAIVLSDIHIPFHDSQAIELALQYGVDNRADLILLNGDIIDCYSLSRWETDPKLRDFPAEVRATKHFLTGLRGRFPHAQIVFKTGNHEERLLRYLRIKAPELLGLPEFDWANVLDLKKLDIQLVDEKRPIRFGKLHIIHGNEYVFNISNPVNPARGLYLRAKVHAICGHFHQSASHSEKDLKGDVISTWSTGCLCDMTPEWLPLNKWNSGFAFIVVDKKGGFRVDNLRIVDGEIW